MYAYEMDVPLPVEAYDRMHAEIVRRGGDQVPGCLVHLVTTTGSGFRVTDVWTSKDAADRWQAEVMLPVAEAVFGPGEGTDATPRGRELQVHHFAIGADATQRV